MSKFDELLASLQGEVEQQGELAKSLPAVETETAGDEDDATIAAAAGADAAAAAGAAAESDDDEGDESEEFGKSFEFTDAAGAKQKGVDATDLVKSLMERTAAAEKRVEETEGALTKALPQILGLIKSQGEMIKSLAAQGRGRKTMLNVAEKPALGDLQKSQPNDGGGMTHQEFFAKANTAFEAGKISGKDLNVVSVSLRMGEAQTLDKSLINKILAS
jgi:hypothetical protein